MKTQIRFFKTILKIGFASSSASLSLVMAPCHYCMFPFYRQDELKSGMLQRPEGSSECILLQPQDSTCHRVGALQGVSLSSQVRRLRVHGSLELVSLETEN